MTEVTTGVREQTRTFPGEPSSVAAARRFVEATLAQWEREDLADTATLLTSELVTNAVVHTGTEIRIAVRMERGHLRVEVHDRSPIAPHVKLYSAEATTGRGLHLVEALADAWGVDPNVGKVVWFHIGASSGAHAGDPAPLAIDLDAWPDLDEATDGGALISVHILGLPLELYRQTTEHSDALQREFTLIAASISERTSAVPSRLVDVVERLQGQYGSFGATNSARLREALDRGDQTIDLAYQVPGAVGAAAEEINRLYDEADDYCRSGELMTLAADGDVIALRRWFLDEFARQARGLPATAWFRRGS